MMAVYHTGWLARDRAKDEALDALAADLYRQSLAGVVILAQRRIGIDRYEYLSAPATKSLRRAA